MTELDALAVELAGTTLIEASAGTGKTHTITTLFVRLLLERPLEVGQILVVTYTNAATAELRRKVRERIATALCAVDGAATGDALLTELARRRQAHRAADRERLRAALLGFDEAAIFTIHGFCQRVLQEHAFDSGVAFDTELSTDQTALLDDIVRDYWAAQLADAPAMVIAAVRGRGVTLDSMIALAKKAALHRDVPVLPERVDDTDLEAALAAWQTAAAACGQLWRAQREGIVTRLRAGLPSLKGNSYPAAKLDPWVACLEALFAGGGPLPLGKDAEQAVRAFSAGQMQLRKKKDGTPPTHAFFTACDRLCEAHDALAGALAACVLRLQLGLVAYARAELRRRKEAANVQFFDDLVQRLADALAGPGAEALAGRLRTRHPAALIDEFQDTDQTQYGIFRRIYHGDADATLFLIGDPKQSIYAFRGADLFAYLAARADAGARAHTLSTSWRSDPAFLAAVNALFDVDAPFFFPQIGFIRMQAPSERADRLDGWPALRLLYMNGDGDGGAVLNKRDAQARAARGAAREIVRVLHAEPTIDGRRVEPRDVAVLCRTNEQARLVQAELRHLGVHAVLQGDASVFDSEEAEAMQRLLAAMADPGDGAALRRALATSILGVDAAGLLALQEDEAAWEVWAARAQHWHESWLQRSFMAAFRRLLEECEVPRRLLSRPDGERGMTNLLHLAELLQRAALEGRRGPLAMVEWLAEMRADGARRVGAVGDAAQIRLESDESALTLLTIHKAKGLEYPIVFVPFAWDGLLLHDSDRACPLAHDAGRGNRLVLDLGSPDLERNKEAAVREARAESLRLLYVALTRAKHHCTLLWGPMRDSKDAALGYLVHRPPTVASPDAAFAMASDRIGGRDHRQLLDDLRGVAQRAAGSIEVAELSGDPVGAYRAAAAPVTDLQARTARRRLDLRWRTSSFTGLAAGGGRLSVPVEEGLDRDEVADDVDGAPAGERATPGALDFPGGRRPGLLVHKLFELLDGRQSPAEMREVIAPLLPVYGVDPQWSEALRGVVDDVLDTPLAGGAAPFRLRDVDPARRLVEVEFTFPIAAGDAVLGAADLARTFARHAAADSVAADYAERVRRLGFAPLQGFLHGFIDLVFEHAGRWYVVDYKSNRLGAHLADYDPAHLPAVMRQHDYVLQYHLYTVAVHRHLRRRLAGYRYERDFGGVYYLFVRGMAPRHPLGCGVFHDRPPLALIESLSAVLDAPEGGRP